MNLQRRTFLRLAAGTAALPAASRIARAQTYPNKIIRLILPYLAGSPNDVLARVVTPVLSSQLGQTVVIENRPGGGTSIGTRAVMTAEPDGYTLLFSNSPVHFIAPFVSKTFSYDPLKDFVPVACVGTTTNVLTIVPSIPVTTLAEFIAFLKANPGKLNFGFGQGTLPHLIGALFRLETGVDFASIPYKGGAQAVTDMLGGHVHINFGTPPTLTPLIRDGRLRALAVTSTERVADLPDVPTMIESGFPNVTTMSYYGIFGPSGLSPQVVSRINRGVNDALKTSELEANLTKGGFGLNSGSPQDFASLIAGEMRKWLPIVTATGFQIE